MTLNRNYEPCEPITWIGRLPVYLATILAGVQALSMIITALLMAFDSPQPSGNSMLSPLVFSFADVRNNFALWQYVTYAFVNPPDLFFIVSIFFFAWFGTDVEKYLGRKSFACLYALLIVAMPVMLTLLAVFGVAVPAYFGSGPVNFAIFLAFTMIYPRAQFFFGIEARWLATIFMVVYSLQYLAMHSWSGLMLLWWGLAVGALWLKFEGVANLQTLSISTALKQRQSARQLKVVQKKSEEESELHESIDPILEKIAREGIGSLSRSERSKLERARAALLEKERGS